MRPPNLTKGTRPARELLGELERAALNSRYPPRQRRANGSAPVVDDALQATRSEIEREYRKRGTALSDSEAVTPRRRTGSE